MSVSCNSIICQNPWVAANVALRTKSTTPVYEYEYDDDDSDDNENNEGDDEDGN